MPRPEAASLPFTLGESPTLGVDPVPTGLELIDINTQVANLSFVHERQNIVGIELRIVEAPTFTRIRFWEDSTSRRDSAFRLAVLEFTQGIDTKREPTLEEMVRFSRVAQHAFPLGDKLANKLAAEVRDRVLARSIAAAERANNLMNLAMNLDSLVVYK
jgi:hypothetical protein